MRAVTFSLFLTARPPPALPLLQLEGCKALAGLTHSPASREEALHIGAAEAVADCMINNSEVPEVQKYGCRALQNVMLASAQAPAKSRVAVQLALQAVCAALQTVRRRGGLPLPLLSAWRELIAFPLTPLPFLHPGPLRSTRTCATWWWRRWARCGASPWTGSR